MYNRLGMSVEGVLERLRLDPGFMSNVSAWERIPPRPASYADFPTNLDTRLISALRSQNLAPLYTHQTDSIEAAFAG